jgi:hypothetical protein
MVAVGGRGCGIGLRDEEDGGRRGGVESQRENRLTRKS